MAKATYKDAGVDLDTYAESMARLPRLIARTQTPRVLKLDGGFAGLFRLDFSNHLFARHYRDPVLVACTDGVGTKLKVASLTGVHSTVGIDLVAMCVNDAICCGAEPLFFLDYVAMPKDDPPLLEKIVEGIAAGCVESDCALLGGETAIMPDLYAPGDYDLAGFCVGVVERKRVIDGSAVVPGDVLIGVASSGLHSNGFSLVRKIVFEIAKLQVDQHVDELEQTVGAALLSPTSPAAGWKRTWDGSCRKGHGRKSTAAVGRSRRCLPGCSAWVKSTGPRWNVSSTWASGWCWWSAPTLPRASAANCREAD